MYMHDMMAGAMVGALFTYAMLTIFSLWLIPTIFYLISMQGALQSVSPKNRMLTPGLVWLNLIPLFGLIWNFFIVTHVSGSLKREFTERGIQDVGDCGQGIGIAMSILAVLILVPVLGWWLASIATLVLWIIYWVKIVELKNRLLAAQP